MTNCSSESNAAVRSWFRFADSFVEIALLSSGSGERRGKRGRGGGRMKGERKGRLCARIIIDLVPEIDPLRAKILISGFPVFLIMGNILEEI